MPHQYEARTAERLRLRYVSKCAKTQLRPFDAIVLLPYNRRSFIPIIAGAGERNPLQCREMARFVWTALQAPRWYHRSLLEPVSYHSG